MKARLHVVVVHLVDEQGIGNPLHLGGGVGEEVAEQQQHTEADQQQVDHAEAPVGSVLVLADGHGPPNTIHPKLGLCANGRTAPVAVENRTGPSPAASPGQADLSAVTRSQPPAALASKSGKLFMCGRYSLTTAIDRLLPRLRGPLPAGAAGALRPTAPGTARGARAAAAPGARPVGGGIGPLGPAAGMEQGRPRCADGRSMPAAKRWRRSPSSGGPGGIAAA